MTKTVRNFEAHRHLKAQNLHFKEINLERNFLQGHVAIEHRALALNLMNVDLHWTLG